MDKPVHVGEVRVYHFPEHIPDDFPDVKHDDVFAVYNQEGKPHICLWGEGSFWCRWGETDADWHVITGVQYWFRIPLAEDIIIYKPSCHCHLPQVHGHEDNCPEKEKHGRE